MEKKKENIILIVLGGIVLMIAVIFAIIETPAEIERDLAEIEMESDAFYYEEDPIETERYNDSLWVHALLNEPLTDEEKEEIHSEFLKFGKSIVTATAYHPVHGQGYGNPLITADMSKIDTVKLKEGKLRWIAVSRDLLKIYNYGDTVLVTVFDDPSMSGEYIVHDTMAKRWTRRIDFLRHPQNRCKGKWHGVLVSLKDRA